MSLSENSPIKSIQDSGDVLNFITTANLYCSCVESYQSQNAIEFLLVVRNNLLALYQAINKLPAHIYLQYNTEYKDDIEIEKLDGVIEFIAERLKNNRYYLNLFDPTDESDRDIGYGDLLDDIGDIYKDLKRSLLIFNIGTDAAKERAIWEFKFNFDNHWGDHCINAIHASHYFLRRESK